MQKNILVVDDSALMRRVLCDIIENDKRLRVAGVAKNGKEALDIICGDRDGFDGVLLDIKMPKMNGLEFLAELKKLDVQTRVLVVSTIAKKDADETIRALELGAFDFICKPESFMEAKEESFAVSVVERLVCALESRRDKKVKGGTEAQTNEDARKEKPSKRVATPTDFVKGTKLLVIASSTGGPQTLHQVIPHLPKRLGYATLIVQHMPEGFTKSLAKRLDELSGLSVKEAENGEALREDVVYVAKGGCQMRVGGEGGGGNRILLSDEAARYGLKPCADILLESLVHTDYEEVVCVVLTGMGSDGTRGIQRLSRYKRLYVIAQDEETCTVYGMPKVVKESGLADEELPISMVAGAICRRLGV